jgi:NADH-quinone oxidoreductase subunit E
MALSGQEHGAASGVAAATAEESIDLSRLDRILEEFKGVKGAVIPILQRAQDTYGYLPREAMLYISRKTLIPLHQLYGVATFYTQFHLKRRGKHLIRVCDGTACHVRGAPKNVDAVRKALRIEPGETTPDYKFSLEIVYCLGSCGLSPVALVDEKVYGSLAPEALVKRLEAIP